MEIHNANDARAYLYEWREYFSQGLRLVHLKDAIQGMALCYAITSSNSKRYSPDTIRGYAEALEVLDDAMNKAQMTAPEDHDES